MYYYIIIDNGACPKSTTQICFYSQFDMYLIDLRNTVQVSLQGLGIHLNVFFVSAGLLEILL